MLCYKILHTHLENTITNKFINCNYWSPIYILKSIILMQRWQKYNIHLIIKGVVQNALLHVVWTEMCLGVLSQTRPEWAVDSLPLFHGRSRCRQEWLLSEWGVLFLDVIMNIAVIIYSRHLSRWRRSGLHLFMKGMHPLIYLNVFMFARIIRDPASPTEEVRIRFS